MSEFQEEIDERSHVRTEEELDAEALVVLQSNFSPSGNEMESETAEKQSFNEIRLERLYFDLKLVKGVDNIVTISCFFQLFDVWIGMYRLSKCFKELEEIKPIILNSVILREKFEFKLIQSLAFTYWKLSKYIARQLNISNS